MTATLNGTERHAAVTLWQEAADRGEALTGAQVGERFGRSPRWGRDRIAEARGTHANITGTGVRESGETLVDEVSAPAGRPWYDTLIVLVVAGVAAAASYGHMAHVASLAGEIPWLARAFPITVDGLVLAALRRGNDGRRWLVLGLAVSVAANVLAQFPDVAANAGPIVSAWPPLALYGTHRLLRGRGDGPHGTGAPVSRTLA